MVGKASTGTREAHPSLGGRFAFRAVLLLAGAFAVGALLPASLDVGGPSRVVAPDRGTGPGIPAFACADGDGDGFGILGDPTCPGGPIPDCDDTNGSVFPGAPEVCDGVNNDCDDPDWPSLVAWGGQPISTDAGGARSVVTADLDGDTDLDALSASSLDGKIAWHENTSGDGSAWTEHVISTAANGARSVFAADMDGDTDLDVLSASSDDDTIAWFENTAGDASAWTEHVISTLVDGARSVFAADVDGDTDLDALSASSGDDTIAWFENSAGDGSVWTRHVISAAAVGARSVHAADVDGDFDLDALSASADDDTIAWYENTTGTGTVWIEHVITATADGAESVHVADVDGDTDLDVLSASSEDDTIAWFENTAGDGSAWTGHVISISADEARSVFAADVDGDADLDALSASSGDDTIAWFENTAGDGSAWAEHVISISADEARSVFAADVDGDADLDALSASSGDGTIAWFEMGSIEEDDDADGLAECAGDCDDSHPGCTTDCTDADGDGVFACAGDCDDGNPNCTTDCTDADADGFCVTTDCDDSEPDCATDCTNGDGDAFAVCGGDCDDANSSVYPGAPEVCDGVNNDCDHPLWPLLGDWTDHVVTTAADGVRSVFAADVDGDGDRDTLSASQWDGKIAWFENTPGDGTAWTEHVISTGVASAQSVFAADLDGDDDIDVLSASAAFHEIAWHENTAGDGTAWTEHVISTGAINAQSVIAADLDGDLDMDVISASSGDDKIAWYENVAGNGSVWTERQITVDADGAIAVFAADVDGDTHIDILSASLGDNSVTWYENWFGDGTIWFERPISISAIGVRSVFAVDVDGDNDIDALSASFSTDEIAWYENTTGAGTGWVQHVISTAANGAQAVFAVDIDGDDDVDALSASSIDDKIAWYENTAGDGSAWTEHVVPTSGAGALSIFAADLDGDDDVDPLSGFFLDDSIAWYEILSIEADDDGDGLAECTGDCDDTNASCTTDCTDQDADGFCATGDCDDGNENCTTDCTDVDGDGFCLTVDCDDGNPQCTSDCSDVDADGYCVTSDCDDGNANCSADCTDVDGDGFCITFDCDDGDPNNWISCAGCGDVDGDTYFAGCDVYLTIDGPDCDDAESSVYPGAPEICDGANNDCDDLFWPWLDRWNETAISSAADGAASVFAADIDGDGDLDAVSASASDGKVAWLENPDGDGTTWTEHVVSTAVDEVAFVFAADVDGDDDFDLLAAASGADRVAWFENTAGDGSAWAEHLISDMAIGVRSVFAADVDGDDDPDVLSASPGDDKIAWYENAVGNGSAWIEHVVSITVDGAVSVFAVDADGDNDLDILSAAFEDDRISWFENTTGDGSIWTEHTISTTLDGVTALSASDIDGDDDWDVLSASSLDGKVVWHENTAGNGSAWVEHSIRTALPGAVAVLAIDFDGDTDVDVASASSLDDRIAWHENTAGDGSVWLERVISETAGGVRSIFAADLGGATGMDVLSACEIDDEIVWYDGNGFEQDDDGDGLAECAGDCTDTNPNCTTDCTDTDSDGYCVTHDCDDTDAVCSIDCSDADSDGFCFDADCDSANPNCTTDCNDTDGDDYCMTHDCDDASAGCTTDCTDADGDDLAACAGDCDDSNSNCLTDCTDVDGDGYCITHDCDDSNPNCTSDCTDNDGDGYCGTHDCDDSLTHCRTDCDDADGDGFCADTDCDESNVHCNEDCTDTDGDQFCVTEDCDDDRPHCSTDCTDTDDDGFCITDDCDDNSAECTTDCTDADEDGVAACQGDCDDTDPSILPGAVEICMDAVDNDCDSLTDLDDDQCASLVVANLRMGPGAGDLTWDEATDAGSYGLYRGTLSDSGPGTYDHLCEASQVGGPAAEDPDAPDSGEGYYYLVAGQRIEGDAFFAGPLGASSNALLRPDSEAISCGPRIHVDPDALVGTNDGLSWATAYTRVTVALRHDSFEDRGLEVWFRGSIVENATLDAVSRSGARLLGGFAGTENAAWERTPETTPTTWDPAAPAEPLLGAGGASIVLDAFTLRNGSTGLAGAPAGRRVELTDLQVEQMSGYAADLVFDSPSGSRLEIRESLFDNAGSGGIRAIAGRGRLNGRIRGNTFVGGSDAALRLEARAQGGDAEMRLDLVANEISQSSTGVVLGAHVSDEPYAATQATFLGSNLIHDSQGHSVTVEATGGFASETQPASALAVPLLVGNTISDGGGAGVAVFATRTDSTGDPSIHQVRSTPEIWDNLITFHAGPAIEESPDDPGTALVADPVVVGNDLYGSAVLYRDEGAADLTDVGQVNALPGSSDNFDADPAYVDRPADDYHLRNGTVRQLDSPMLYFGNRTPPPFGPEWTELEFEDSGWDNGNFGVGYENGAPPNADALLNTIVLSNSASVYVRVPFTVDLARAVTALTLEADYDDGIAAWINGVEVYRSPSLPAGPLNWNTPSSEHESSNAAAPVFEQLDISAAGIPALQDGGNVLAIGVWNATLPSSDLVLVTRLTLDEERAPIDAGHVDAPRIAGEDIDGDSRTLDGDGNGIALPDVGADER